MSAADAVLARLLRRAESARRRGDDRPAAINMAGVEEYTTLRTLPEFETFHARIAMAERAGALQVKREARAGDGSSLLRLSVRDAAVLASHLGVSLLSERVAAAEWLLEPWRMRFPVLEAVLVAWGENRKLRGAGPEAAQDLADAASAVAARLDDAGSERVLRRESARLFRDSKRLEKITRWLELLATGELIASGLSEVEVWALLGLRREPQPLLISGAGTATVGEVVLPLLRPFIGLPLEQLRALRTDARCLVSIENLASFHDATKAPGAEQTLLLYTGGMPSPAWRAAYARILACLPTALPIYHWGDIDEGGFRIAAKISETAAEVGKSLQPWLMAPDELPNEVYAAAPSPTPSQLARMCRWAALAGWLEVSAALHSRPIQLEQEQLDIHLPSLHLSP